MTLKVGMAIQVCAFILHGVLTQTTLLTGDWSKVAHLVLGGLQLLLASKAWDFNRDGTPSTVAYVPPAPRKDQPQSFGIWL